jgi:DNA-directed RNA polymerase specialized sigma24 family protein
MADDHEETAAVDTEEVVRMLDDVRSRLRVAIWALHGMHQDLSSLSVDDIADIEHMLTETLERLLTPASEAVSQLLQVNPGGPLTTH